MSDGWLVVRSNFRISFSEFEFIYDLIPPILMISYCYLLKCPLQNAPPASSHGSNHYQQADITSQPWFQTKPPRCSLTYPAMYWSWGDVFTWGNVQISLVLLTLIAFKASGNDWRERKRAGNRSKLARIILKWSLECPAGFDTTNVFFEVTVFLQSH